MRIFSLLAAITVSALLYLWVFQRPETMARLGMDAPDAPADTQAIPESDLAQEAAAEARSGLVKVVVQRSEAREIETAVALRGETAAARQVEVRAETASTVTSEPLRKGAAVDTGQLLCELDEGTRGVSLEQARAQLDEAQSRVPEAEAMVKRAQAQIEEARINQNASARLSDSGFASTTRVASADAALAVAESSLESARAGVEAAASGIRSAQANVASAEKEIERLTIEAPFAGLLETDTAELGALLQPGDLCATVIQLDPIKIVGFVPEAEIKRVSVGAETVTRLVTGDLVEGAVTFVSRSADPTTRTFRVEIEVPNSDLRIRDGQAADISISTDSASAHLLPQSALTLNDDGRLGVRTIEDGNIVAFHAVDLMRDTPQGVWLTGLPDSADVIVVGQEYVIAGVEADPTYRDLGQ
ncbi:efflux RND transporter periplasmic adaptor subunit [Sulfitobacter sp. D35]|uniref:efflux RND transporter periplasmic adaptor subunit n=1 Tax=Sulfitobacter sp. D35 TaxID=3083252 RepID=UPI00296FFB29|nr:efflux RND transporter periplasmic adaptor subunit [Sulfitobacter sp. D35]MDW4497029.1 efflux RND transporter periplasmic adaptor subunit [Sulfitobacter sp. D35]